MAVVVNDILVWDWGERPSLSPITGSVLTDFWKLSDAPDSAFVGFVRRWGVFKICVHGRPSHSEHAEGEYAWGDEHNHSPHGVPCLPMFEKDPGGVLYFEPLDYWRTLVREVRALIELADRLRNGKAPRVDLWLNLRGIEAAVKAAYIVNSTEVVKVPDKWDQLIDSTHLDSDASFGRNVLGIIVDEWLRASRVRPLFGWDNQRPRLTLRALDLYGALAIELAQVVSRTKGYVLCSACGGIYLPKKQPAASRDRYCGDCGRLEAVRAASRRYRQKQRTVPTE